MKMEHWYLACKLKNGIYAFFHAYCDYTGFDCRGGIELTLADNIENLIEYGMGNVERCTFYEFQTL